MGAAPQLAGGTGLNDCAGTGVVLKKFDEVACWPPGDLQGEAINWPQGDGDDWSKGAH
jgi:hypothetical protein